MSLTDRKKDDLTLLLIPHTGKEPVSLKLPAAAPRFLAAALVLAGLFLTLFAQSYLYLSSQVEELSYLEDVTRAQRAEINHLAHQTRQLQQQVAEVEELSAQIREILGLVQEAGSAEPDALSVVDPVRDQLADRSGYRFSTGGMDLDSLRQILLDKAEELQGLVDLAEEYQHRLEHTPSIWPAQGRITSPFGQRRSPITRRLQFHRGIDIANSTGTPVLATASGRVVEASYRSGWGRLIIVDHGYGFRTYYAHLRAFAVSVGDTVSKGQRIGSMGNSGSSTGTHLHYEVHVRGEPVNPREYMN
jgi:murein DD-endopeptidase MepM/ murein hydrolase activator NlpD